MPFRIASAESRLLAWLLLVLLGWAAIGTADEPAHETTDAPAAIKPPVARPAEVLAGELVRVRPANDRKDDQDLLNQIDVAKDVVYVAPENPVPVDQQFQFVDGALRMPAEGDARLCLPVEVPKFYHLSLALKSTAPDENRPVGIGVVLEGRQFLVQARALEYDLGDFLGRSISGKFMYIPNHSFSFGKTGPTGTTELFVGDTGFVLQQDGRYLEWFGKPEELSLDLKWAIPATDKLFLTAPAGQFDLVSIKLEPLTRDEWLQKVSVLLPKGRIAWADFVTHKGKISPTVEPLPPFDSLRPTIRLLGYRGDFDELEQWADRFRKEELVIGNRFASETLYEWLGQLYLTANHGGVGSPPDLWQLQFAFADAWLKHRPDSVAAHIVKARSGITYAWNARGGGYANTVSPQGAKLFQQRIEEAEEILDRAARLPTSDVCVFSSLLTVGMAQGWDHGKMELTLERGLQITKKDHRLYAAMVQYLLPRWHGKPGDVGKLAERMSVRVKGDDGLDTYARVAMSSHGLGVDFDEFSTDKLKAAVPIWIKRYPDHPYMMNYACWLCCKLEDRETAKSLFDKIAKIPDVDIWRSREQFDTWRHWSDPSVPQVSQFLAAEPDQAANVQAYTGDLVHVAFLPDSQTLVTGSVQSRSEFKFWDLKQQLLVRGSTLPTRNWTVEDVRILSDGNLFALISDDENQFCAMKKPPDYDQMVAPVNHRGLEITLASDDWNTGVKIDGLVATADHTRELARKTFAVPKMSTTALSRDGKYLLGVDDKLHLWDTHSGEEVSTIDVQPLKVEFLADNSGIAYATERQWVVWDIAGRRERISAPLERCTVRAIASSSDGRLLATADQRTDADGAERHVVSLWDLKQPEPVHTFAGHQQPLGDLVFSADGKLLASSSLDGIVKVWKVEGFVPPAAGDSSAGATDKPAEEAAEDSADSESAAPAE